MNFIEFKNEYKKRKSQEEKNEFIQTRINDLMNKDTSCQRIGMDITGSYNGFISPATGVSSNKSGMFQDLSIDDMGVYKDFMEYIGNDVDTYLFGEPSTIHIVQKYIWNYFGYNASLSGRIDIYDYTDCDEKLSIQELKGKNVAACSERSALSQNILKFLGFDSEIVFGKLNGPHAYIIFKTGNGMARVLYDPMNPIKYNENSYCPGVSMMTEIEYNNLKNGGDYTFDYSLAKKVFIGDNDFDDRPRKYTCDDMLVKEKNDNLNKIKEEYIKTMVEPYRGGFDGDDVTYSDGTTLTGRNNGRSRR